GRSAADLSSLGRPDDLLPATSGSVTVNIRSSLCATRRSLGFCIAHSVRRIFTCHSPKSWQTRLHDYSPAQGREDGTASDSKLATIRGKRLSSMTIIVATSSAAGDGPLELFACSQVEYLHEGPVETHARHPEPVALDHRRRQVAVLRVVHGA